MPACPVCGKDNPAGFDFCGFCRASMTGASAGADERKLATLLFADLAGSTELGSRLDPEHARALLQTYFSAMAETIGSWGGTVEKYIGDAVMAVFGVPLLREDDAERAVRAAIEMLDRLEALNRGFAERYGVTLGARIGVNTGEVIAPAGATGHLIVTGDAINVAARLEQAAQTGTVLVGERTYIVTRGAVRFEGPIPLELKGKEGTVLAYRVLGPEPGREGTRGDSGLRSRLVGRDREVDALLALLDGVVSTGRPRMVVVQGPAGIGKSRLVHEFEERAAAARSDLSIHAGRCLAVDRGVTYWALGDILRSVFGIALDDPSSIANSTLRRGVGEALRPLDLRPDDVLRTTFALATTAGFTMPANPLDEMGPEEVWEQLARAWPRLVSALAVPGPLVLVCEDLHWADDLLLEMLERLTARSSGSVLFVATARPEFARDHPGFPTERAETSWVSVEPLTAEQSEELVTELLSDSPLPASLLTEISEKAEGNPLFVEELLRRLVDEGALVREGSRWRMTSGADTTSLPDTIHGLLAARIDSLPSEEKRVLQEASVVGRTFWEEPVARAVGDGVGSALRALERKGFLTARPVSSFAGQPEFQFLHALIRDVAYSGLPKVRRAHAHAELAEWLEGVAGDRRTEFVELIAHHYATAVTHGADLAWYEEPARRETIERKAFDALVVAGTVARRRYALRRAAELHARAAALAPNELARASALEALGDDHNAAVHGDEAVSSYREAIAILRRTPEADEDRGRVCMVAARMILEKSGAFSSRQSPAIIDELVDEGRRCASDEGVLAWLRALWGAAAVWWLDAGVDSIAVDERIRSLRSVIGGVGADPFPEVAAFAREYLCELSMIRGDYGEVVEMTRRSERLERITSVPDRALLYVEAGIWTLQVAGEAERALELGMRSYASAKDLSPHELMHSTGFVISVLYQLGRWSDLTPILAEHVAAFLEEADSTCEMLRGGILAGATVSAHRGDLKGARDLEAMAPPFVPTDPLWAGYADGWRARLQVAAGDPAAGRRQAETMFGSAQPWRRFHAGLVLVDALVALDDREALSRFLPEARALCGGMALLSPVCDRAEGASAAGSGDIAAARRSLSQAVDGFDRLDVPFEAARTRELLASVSPPTEAREQLEDVVATYEALGAEPHAARARALLGETEDAPNPG